MNPLEAYKIFATEVTDAPSEFHDYLSIATAGIILGRRRYIAFGDDFIYPNFYMLILAPSSMFRKSTCLGIAQKVVRNVNALKVYPSEFSQEKVLEIIQANSEGAFFYYEFKTLMGLLSRDYMMGAKAFLTEIYDNPEDYTRATKGGSVNIEKPCISLISATTQDWFVSSIKEGDIEGGFLGRFLYVFAHSKRRQDDIPPKADIDKKVAMYNAYDFLYRKVPIGEMTLSEESRAVYKHWYMRHVSRYDKLDPSYRTLVARLNIYILKIAIILETCHTGSFEISIGTMKESIMLIDYVYAQILRLCRTEISANKNEAMEKKVMKYLEEKGKLSRTELLRFTHMSSFDFHRTMQTLLDKEYVVTERVQNTDKPTTLYGVNSQNTPENSQTSEETHNL